MSELMSVTGESSPFDTLRREDELGEYWLARELVTPLGYSKWQYFRVAIERATLALTMNGERVSDHLTQVSKMVRVGSSARRGVEDYRLSRHGVYAIIQGADPRKPEIAAGWAYFRVKTRAAEVAESQLTHLDPDLRQIMSLTLGMQRTRDELERVRTEQARIADELAQTAERVALLADDVRDVKAITPLVGGDHLTVRDAARAITGMDMGQNLFAAWLVERGILFRDHNENLRCYQPWITRGLATESYELWPNARGWSWVTRFTSRGVAELRDEYETCHGARVRTDSDDVTSLDAGDDK